MDLPVGTRIRTKDDSSCALSFGDLSTFVLKSNSEVIIKSPPERDSKFDILVGNVWVNIKRMFKEGSMEIEMNNASAGIRGT